jgi:hypothetical protein
MSPLWLLLIVPFTAAIGYVIACFMWMSDDSDERCIKLLDRQYRELRAEGENYTPSVNAWAEMIARHKAERKALDE